MDGAEIRESAATELDAQRLHDLLRLRVDVFVVEQQCPYHELDGRDLAPGTRHLWIDDDDGVVACLRLLDEGGRTRIGRVATAPRARGCGLAGRLMDHALTTTSGPMILDAQAHLTDWYARFGFETSGGVFDEDGIPHQTMVLMRTPNRSGVGADQSQGRAATTSIAATEPARRA